MRYAGPSEYISAIFDARIIAFSIFKLSLYHWNVELQAIVSPRFSMLISSTSVYLYYYFTAERALVEPRYLCKI